MHYTCIACMTIDSVMIIDKKPSTGLFRRVQIQNEKNTNAQFTNIDLKSDSDSELDSEEESKLDAELMTKLESGPDSA